METWLAIVPFFSVSLCLGLSCYILIRLGELSFGQQAFFGIGAYTAAICTTVLNVGLLPALLFGALAAGVFAVLSGAAAIRVSGLQFTIFTLVLGEFVREVLNQFNFRIDRGDRSVGPEGPLGLSGIDYFHDHQVALATQALWTAVFALILISGTWWFFRSRHGQIVDAVAIDPALAASVGVNVYRVRLQVFCISAIIAGVGGGLFAHYATYVDPSNFSLMMGVHAVAYALIGGIGSVLGPVIGTALDIVLLEWLRVFGPYRMLAFGCLIVAMMIFRPQGILGSPSTTARSLRQVANGA